MSDINWKQWLLRNERAVMAMTRGRSSLTAIANIYRVPAGEMLAFADEFNDGNDALEPAKLHAIRVKLGILSTTPAPKDGASQQVAAPAVTRAVAAQTPAVSQLPPASVAKGVTKPWLRHGPTSGPRPSAFAKYRPLLEALAQGKVKGGHNNTTRVFLNYWFRTQNPSPDLVREFLAWCAAGRRVAVKPMVGAGLKVEGTRKTRPLADGLDAAFPPGQPALSQTTRQRHVAPDGTVFTFEVSVRLVSVAGGAS